jgi:hypothetical protein
MGENALTVADYTTWLYREPYPGAYSKTRAREKEREARQLAARLAPLMEHAEAVLEAAGNDELQADRLEHDEATAIAAAAWLAGRRAGVESALSLATGTRTYTAHVWPR